MIAGLDRETQNRKCMKKGEIGESRNRIRNRSGIDYEQDREAKRIRKEDRKGIVVN